MKRGARSRPCYYWRGYGVGGSWGLCFFCGGDKRKKSDKSFLIGLVVGGGNLLSHTRVQYHWRERA